MHPVGYIDETDSVMVACGRRRAIHLYIPNQDQEIEEYLERSSEAGRTLWQGLQLQYYVFQ